MSASPKYVIVEYNKITTYSTYWRAEEDNPCKGCFTSFEPAATHYDTFAEAALVLGAVLIRDCGERHIIYILPAYI